MVSTCNASFSITNAVKVLIDNSTAVEAFDISDEEHRGFKELHLQLSHRKVWMAASIHKGEIEVIVRAHQVLKQMHPELMTIIVPRQPQYGRDIELVLRKEGLLMVSRSCGDMILPETNIYVVDTVGELRKFYKLVPIAFVGHSLFPGSRGKNFSEAAAAGCATLIGFHLGHFSQMAVQMRQFNPLSILQVSGETLVDALNDLFKDVKILEARRIAAKQTHDIYRNG